MCSEILSAHCTSKRQNGPGKQMGNYNSNNLDDGSGGYVLRHIEMCTIGHEILIGKRRSIILENISESSVGLTLTYLGYFASLNSWGGGAIMAPP